jgi:hypothetical protein
LKLRRCASHASSRFVQTGLRSHQTTDYGSAWNTWRRLTIWTRTDAPFTRQVANTLVFDGLVDAVDEPSAEGVRAHPLMRQLIVPGGLC